jgi:hypothetical protein
MDNNRADLSSIATQLSEMTQRVAAAGERLHRDPTEDAAVSLFEVERALRTAMRSLERALSQLE